MNHLKPRIAIDLDQTLFATFESAWKYFQTTQGWSISAIEAMSMRNGWWKYPSINISQQQAFQMFDSFITSSYADEITPVE